MASQTAESTQATAPLSWRTESGATSVSMEHLILQHAVDARGVSWPLTTEVGNRRPEASQTMHSGPGPVTWMKALEAVRLRPGGVPGRLETRFELLAKWEGKVLSIGPESFTVRLVDLIETGPAEEAELPLTELSATDRQRLREGTELYWFVGYQHTASGQKIRASLVQLKRLPSWSSAEIDATNRWVERMRGFGENG